MTPQDITVTTYQENFNTYKEKTPRVVSGEFIDLLNNFVEKLPHDAYVMELGSAEGRDARYLRDKKVRVLCTDVIPQALVDLEHDGFETSLYDFRDEHKRKWSGGFDGVFAIAVFLHATQEIFESALMRLAIVLKPHGVMCLTFKIGVGEEIETDKLGGERYFKYYSKDDLVEIFSRHVMYEIISIVETSDRKWVQVLIKKV